MRAQADKVRRDYRRGALEAEDYTEQRAEIAEELAAAEAEQARLTAQAEEILASTGVLDEDETLQRLAVVRAAVAGRVNGADDVPAVRAALSAVFEFVAVIPEADLDAIPHDPPDLTRLCLVPAARDDMVLASPEDHEPFSDVGELRRVPVAFDGLPYTGPNKTSGTPLPRKLGIKPGHRVALLGAPDGFERETLGELPDGVRVGRRAGGTADVIVSFHTGRAELERRLPALRGDDGARRRACGSRGPSARRRSRPTSRRTSCARSRCRPGSSTTRSARSTRRGAGCGSSSGCEHR